MMAQRRTRGDGSIYQRADGRWLGVVDLGWIGGKRRRRTVSASTLRELRPKMRALQESIELGVLPSDATVAQWLDHWLDHIAAKEVRPRTLDSYRSSVERWVVPVVGKVRLDRLKPDQIRAIDAAMVAAGKGAGTRRQAYAVLHRALNAAVMDRRIASSPMVPVKAPPPSRLTHGVLSREETMALLDLLAAYAADGMWALASRWLAALLAGLRQGEALGLRWEDVDLTPGAEVAYVVRTVQRQPKRGLVEAPTKSGKPRPVPLVGPLAEALRQHRATAPEGYVWQGYRAGNPRDPRRDWGEWKMMLWSADVADHPLHAARATTASVLSEAGVPLKTIAEVLGHAQISTSWAHYVHSDARQMREGLEAGLRSLGR